MMKRVIGLVVAVVAVLALGVSMWGSGARADGRPAWEMKTEGQSAAVAKLFGLGPDYVYRFELGDAQYLPHSGHMGFGPTMDDMLATICPNGSKWPWFYEKQDGSGFWMIAQQPNGDLMGADVVIGQDGVWTHGPVLVKKGL